MRAFVELTDRHGPELSQWPDCASVTAAELRLCRGALARHGLDLAPPVTPAVTARQAAQRARRQRERARRTPDRARDAELARWHGLRWRHGS